MSEKIINPTSEEIIQSLRDENKMLQDSMDKVNQDFDNLIDAIATANTKIECFEAATHSLVELIGQEIFYCDEDFTDEFNRMLRLFQTANEVGMTSDESIH